MHHINLEQYVLHRLTNTGTLALTELGLRGAQWSALAQ